MSQTKLGIIGGGQLGRMLTTAATELNILVTVIDPGENPPAVQVGAKHIKAGLSDVVALEQLMNESDVVTWEIEHISVEAINQAKTNSKNKEVIIQPDVETLAMIQDKLEQKKVLEKNGIKVAQFKDVDSCDSAIDFFNKCYQGVVLKTRRGGFDGRGNIVVRDASKFSELSIEPGEYYAEELVDIDIEVSAIVARAADGSTATYDLVDMVHENSICHLVSAPTKITEQKQLLCLEAANNVMELLHGAGVFAIEMFITSQGEVLVNEIAPRVHNSGHHTIEGCDTSQFEQHVRAVVGLPLGSTNLVSKSVVMVNLIGSVNSESKELVGVDKALALGANLHWYGKYPIKPERKMGHLTFTSDEPIDMLVEKALEARKVIEI